MGTGTPEGTENSPKEVATVGLSGTEGELEDLVGLKRGVSWLCENGTEKNPIT